jgi:hypothetical protein
MIDLNAIRDTMESILTKPQLVTSRAEYQEALKHRAVLDSLLSQLHDTYEQMAAGIARLPRLAPLHIVQWATAMLKLPNVAVLVLDTTGLNQDADILRVLLINMDGQEIYHQVIRPHRTTHPNTPFTGLQKADLATSPTLAEVWGDIQEALAGWVVISYNLEWLRARLAENASQYGCDLFSFIGFDLEAKAWEYFRMRPKLVMACARIGHELPEYPSALQRAQGQLALLHAMAEGILSKDVPRFDEEELPDDDHPF